MFWEDGVHSFTNDAPTNVGKDDVSKQ